MQTSLANLPVLALTLWRRLGLWGALRYVFCERIQLYVRWRRRASSGTYSLPVRGVTHPLWCRPRTSDRWAFAQVFVIEIELHSQEGARLFRHALGEDAFHYTVCGEITVAARTDLAEETHAAFGRHR